MWKATPSSRVRSSRSRAERCTPPVSRAVEYVVRLAPVPFLTTDRRAGSVRRFIAVAALTVLIGASVAGTSTARSIGAPKTLPALCGLPYVKGDVVRFAAADGTRLVGATAGTGTSGVLFANGWGDSSDRICAWVGFVQSKLANALIADEHRLFFFDYRNQGFSAKGPEPEGPDLVAAVKELHRLGVQRIVIVTGGTGALVTSSVISQLRPAVQGIVALSPGGYPGATSTVAHTGGPVDGKKAIARVTEPLLFYTLRGDQLWYPRTVALYRAAQAHDKQLVVLPGGSMNEDLFNDVDRANRVIAGTRAFVQKHLAAG